MSLDTVIFFSIAVIILALLVAYVYLVKKRRIKPGTDYRALFTFGPALFIVGVAIGNTALWVVGLMFFISGAVNKKKWKDSWQWSKLMPAEKIFKIAIIIFSIILVVLGLVIYFI